jgi:C1A family cysteine protease
MIDLREKCPPVYDQGELGSCTANAIGAAHQFEQMKQTSKSFIPSRLFIYYNERAMEGTSPSEDSGAQIRDGIKSIAKQGVCPETEWPYDIKQFSAKPSSTCYKDALNHQALTYARLMQASIHMKGCLAAGYPFVFGFSVYESFESLSVARTGRVYMPKKTERQLGGHAVMAVGYDDALRRFIVRNSWGEKWGMKGYFTIPYDYLVNDDLSADFWTVRLVEE